MALAGDVPRSDLLPVVVLDGVPRICLRTKEVARFTGIEYREILAMINAGRIRVIAGVCRGYLIPVSELDEIYAWAELTEFQTELRHLTGRRGPWM